MIISDIHGYGGCKEAKNFIMSTHFGDPTQCLVHPTVPYISLILEQIDF